MVRTFLFAHLMPVLIPKHLVKKARVLFSVCRKITTFARKVTEEGCLPIRPQTKTHDMNPPK